MSMMPFPFPPDRYDPGNEREFRAAVERELSRSQIIAAGVEVGSFLALKTQGKLGLFGVQPAAQPAAIADSTGSSGANQAAINAILAALRTLGVIAT